MAHTESLPDDILDAVVEQVGMLLPSTADAMNLDSRDVEGLIEMAETFEVWVLDVNKIVEGVDDLAKLARTTGCWHHQITQDGAPQSFARSCKVGDPGKWQVTELFESELAGKIDKAISWIDENVSGDPLVRLLAVPAYQLNGFWLFDRVHSQVFLVDCPATLRYLHPGELLDEKDFLNSLRKEKPIAGRVQSNCQ
jgi:hypothetical protein